MYLKIYYTKYLFQPQWDEVINQPQKENWKIHKYVEINTFLNKWVKDETTREIKKYLEMKMKSQHTKTYGGRASLVVQCLRILLPMQGTQGTQVLPLVWEDPTCCGATKPVHHNYLAWALEPVSHNYWSLRAYSPSSATREATTVRSLCTTMKGSSCLSQLEKALVQQQRPNATKNK